MSSPPPVAVARRAPMSLAKSSGEAARARKRAHTPVCAGRRRRRSEITRRGCPPRPPSPSPAGPPCLSQRAVGRRRERGNAHTHLCVREEGGGGLKSLGEDVLPAPRRRRPPGPHVSRKEQWGGGESEETRTHTCVCGKKAAEV